MYTPILQRGQSVWQYQRLHIGCVPVDNPPPDGVAASVARTVHRYGKGVRVGRGVAHVRSSQRSHLRSQLRQRRQWPPRQWRRLQPLGCLHRYGRSPPMLHHQEDAVNILSVPNV